ncbi:hypothetical protein [Variovorax paradoxus]|uniref:hypothetical protein n=1 Tax=Variovorax paradoxus TaxID=34073 RepID=UPI0019320E6A|nr:hypothetical protein INQ48_18220 [Variovorax paradoxus]
MTDRELAEKLYTALKRITAYMPPDKLAAVCQRRYALEYEEALEMAYENVLSEAANAIRGVRRPRVTRAAAAIGEGKT